MGWGYRFGQADRTGSGKFGTPSDWALDTLTIMRCVFVSWVPSSSRCYSETRREMTMVRQKTPKMASTIMC